MEILRQQLDELNVSVWHFLIVGLASDGKCRTVSLSRETPDPETWLAANQAEAQGLTDTGQEVLKIDGSYIPLPLPSLAEVRLYRDKLLQATDWTETASHLTRAQRKQWQIYRQALRDITEQSPVVWPTPPDQTPDYNGYGWLAQLPLEEASEWARMEVNYQAGERRAYYGTDISFQGAIYLRKQAEVQGPMPNYPAFEWPGFLNDPEPSAEKYPILYQEAAGRGITPEALAQEYKANAALWPQLMAAIEAVRIPTGDAIKAAPDHQAVIAIIASLSWPV